jgi:hypothetical protein
MVLLKNIRNQLDYFVRSKIRFAKELPQDFEIPLSEKKFQEEIKEFLEQLNFKNLFVTDRTSYIVCDVGAKNFSLAPVLDGFLQEANKSGEIHGIEIDAYRRLSDFRTRADYARYFSRKARAATFHPIDFLSFQKMSDVILMLNPFVSKDPLLAWGLPLKYLKPIELFTHAYDLLLERKGNLILSSPSEDEFEISSQCAKQAGFKLGMPVFWHPKPKSIQKKSRFGRVCSIYS